MPKDYPAHVVWLSVKLKQLPHIVLLRYNILLTQVHAQNGQKGVKTRIFQSRI